MSTQPSKQLPFPVRIALVSVIASCLAFVVIWVSLYFVPGLALLPVLASAKTSPYCTQLQAIADATVKTKQAEMAKDFRARSKPIRIDGDYKLWSTPSGEFWVPDSSDDIIAILLAQQTRKIYGDESNGGVKKGDIVLDCGAHVGTYVKTALDAGAAKVVAIEPSPKALECLRRNFRNEIASGRVVVYPKGVWDEEKQLVLFDNGNGAAGDSFLEQGAGAKKIADIPVTTIDKIVKELNLPRVDLIKADVKGAGTRMVKAAGNTILAYRPRIIISTEEAPEDPSSIFNAVMTISPGYKFRSGPCLYTEGEVRNDTVFFQ